MKRYLLFMAGSNCYEGGWQDFGGSFDDLEQAREHAEKLAPGRWHVVDTKTETIVFYQ